MTHFDTIIIGTGLANSGQKVAIIEKSHLGGTCVNHVCIPTKAYVASARRTFIAKNSAGLGITAADEYIHGILDLMYAGAPYTVIRDAVHIHPIVSELIPTMLENLELIEPET